MKTQQLRSEEVRKKKKNKMRGMTAIIIAGAVVLGGIFIYSRTGKGYNYLSRVRTVELSNLAGSRFMPYKNGVLKLNSDGAEATSAEGKQFWNISFDVKDITADVCGSYAAIGDFGGNTVYVINGSGQSQSIELPYAVKEVEVANQGVTAVLTSNGEEDYTYLYRTDTLTPVSEINTKTGKDGFPVNISLSDDGKKLVTSYLKANADSFGCEVVFHNFSEVGQNYTDRLLGSWQYGNEFVTDVEFLTNDRVLALKDHGMSLYSFQEIPEEIKNVTFNGAIKSSFYNAWYVGFVVEKEEEANNYELVVFDLNGKEIIKKNFDYSFNQVSAFEKHIIFYNNSSCQVLNLDGKKEFEGTFERSVTRIFSGDSEDRLLVLTESGFDVIDMMKTKEKKK